MHQILGYENFNKPHRSALPNDQKGLPGISLLVRWVFILMNDLITIKTTENGNPAVSARELYEFLGYNPAAWSRWCNTNIIKNNFAIDGVDYTRYKTYEEALEAGLYESLKLIKL